MKIIQAGSVAEAQERLVQGQINAVLCDWLMPGEGGEALLKWMRACPVFKYVSFVMISGKSDQNQIIEAFMELGVDGYITKPFAINTVLRADDDRPREAPLRRLRLAEQSVLTRMMGRPSSRPATQSSLGRLRAVDSFQRH